MRRFLIKIALFLILTLFGLSFILIKYGGFVDYFYEKFTVPPQTSMILGDSRSLQGIQPRIINQELKDAGYNLPMFNYSFTVAQINYGKPYTESIKKKLQPSKNGLFILNVNPWLFTEREGDDLKNGVYSESGAPPNNMHFVNTNPNLEYFFRNFSYFHFRAIFSQKTILHKNGLLEDNNPPKDAKILKEWKNIKVTMYKDFSKTWKKSAIRVKDFSALISFLQKNGQVVLVRIPVDQEISKIENKFWKDFDQQMQSLSSQKNVQYLNFSKSNKYHTYDGNHIDKDDSVIFTQDLCDSIKIKR